MLLLWPQLIRSFSQGLVTPGIPQQCHPGGDRGRHSMSLAWKHFQTVLGISGCCPCSDRLGECFPGLGVSAWSWRGRGVISPDPSRAAGLQCSLPGLSSPCSQPVQSHPKVQPGAGTAHPCPLSPTVNGGIIHCSSCLGKKECWDEVIKSCQGLHHVGRKSTE